MESGSQAASFSVILMSMMMYANSMYTLNRKLARNRAPVDLNALSLVNGRAPKSRFSLGRTEAMFRFWQLVSSASTAIIYDLNPWGRHA
jgi:hypothetical protein